MRQKDSRKKRYVDRLTIKLMICFAIIGGIIMTPGSDIRLLLANNNTEVIEPEQQEEVKDDAHVDAEMAKNEAKLEGENTNAEMGTEEVKPAIVNEVTPERATSQPIAEEPASKNTTPLWVNGTNILTAAGNVVNLGAGTATYDVANNTLTLNNATINTPTAGTDTAGKKINVGIYKEGTPDTANPLKIILQGDNTITTSGTSTGIYIGVYTRGILEITGSGSLDIAVKSSASSSTRNDGIYAESGFSITGSTLSIKDTATALPLLIPSGIRVDGDGAKFTANDATMTFKDFKKGDGIFVKSTDISIVNTNIDIANCDFGIGTGSRAASIVIDSSVITVDTARAGISSSNDMTITNSKVKAVSKDSQGINIIANITITGKSNVEVAGGKSAALYSGKSVAITDSTVKAVSTNSNGINAGGGITITNGSNLEIEGYNPAIRSVGDAVIANSTVKATSTNSNAIYTNKSALTIKDGAKVELNGNSTALYSDTDTTIANSTVKATSKTSNAIYAGGNILIDGDADINANGHFGGIAAVHNITINSGVINAVSATDQGIWARDSITINSGDIHVKSPAGQAAIAVRYEKQASDTDPSAKIMLNSNYNDTQGGKVSVSDWYSGTDSGIAYTRNWTSFIAKNEDKLTNNLNNALNEITIKIKEADYTKVDEAIAKANELNKEHYVDFSSVTAAIDAVVRGKNITEQNLVDGYAQAIENAIAALVLKPVGPSDKIHEIILGADQTIEQGDKAIFGSDAEFKDFQKVFVDGNEISIDNYTVTSGSTIITLKESYTKTLAVGKHTLSVVSATGTASTTFWITASAEGNVPPTNDGTPPSTSNGDITPLPSNAGTTSPVTGDTTDMWILTGMLFLSIGMMTALLLTIKRNKLTQK